MISYLYYAYYKFILMTPSKNELPEHLANTTLSFLLSLNILTIMYILRSKNIGGIVNIYLDNKIYFAGVFVIFLFLFYFLFIKEKQYLVIKNKFDKEVKIKRIIKMCLVFIYSVLSFILPLLLGYYM